MLLLKKIMDSLTWGIKESLVDYELCIELQGLQVTGIVVH